MAERENTGAKIQSGNGGLSVRSGLSGNELKVIAIIAMAADRPSSVWPSGRAYHVVHDRGGLYAHQQSEKIFAAAVCICGAFAFCL